MPSKSTSASPSRVRSSKNSSYRRPEQPPGCTAMRSTMSAAAVALEQALGLGGGRFGQRDAVGAARRPRSVVGVSSGHRNLLMSSSGSRSVCGPRRVDDATSTHLDAHDCDGRQCTNNPLGPPHSRSSDRRVSTRPPGGMGSAGPLGCCGVSFLRRKPTDDRRPTEPRRREPEAARRRQGPADARSAARPRAAAGRCAPPPKTQREAMKRSKVAGQVDDQGRAAGRCRRAPRADDGRRRLRCCRATAARSGPTSATWSTPGGTSPASCCRSPCCRSSSCWSRSPLVQAYGPLVLLVAITGGDHRLDHLRPAGRPRRSGAKFPNGDDSGQSTKGTALGFYAFNRACLIRTWRVPRPRVDAGAADRLSRSTPVRDDLGAAASGAAPTRSCAGSSAPTAG